MLILTRRKEESLIIDSTIRITILKISGATVRLGVNAPPDVPVYREEVYRSILCEGADGHPPAGPGFRPASGAPEPSPAGLDDRSVGLVLTRRKGERLVLDGTIWVTIVNIFGNAVRLGIDAPRDVRVDREEVHQARMHRADSSPHVARAASEPPGLTTDAVRGGLYYEPIRKGPLGPGNGDWLRVREVPVPISRPRNAAGEGGQAPAEDGRSQSPFPTARLPG